MILRILGILVMLTHYGAEYDFAKYLKNLHEIEKTLMIFLTFGVNKKEIGIILTPIKG